MEEALKFIGARPSGGCVGPGEGAGGGSAPGKSLHSSASPETPAGRHIPTEVSIGHHGSLDTLGTHPCPGGDLPHQGGDTQPPLPPPAPSLPRKGPHSTGTRWVLWVGRGPQLGVLLCNLQQRNFGEGWGGAAPPDPLPREGAGHTQPQTKPLSPKRRAGAGSAGPGWGLLPASAPALHWGWSLIFKLLIEHSGRPVAKLMRGAGGSLGGGGAELSPCKAKSMGPGSCSQHRSLLW